MSTTLPAVGTILANSWGMTMRMTSFYQVVRTTEKRIFLKELKQTHENTGFLSGKAMPVPNEFENDEEIAAKWVEDACIGQPAAKSKFGRSGYADYAPIWNGKPLQYDYCD